MSAVYWSLAMNHAADLPHCARMLVLSIVNPVVERNGAFTVTRGLLKRLMLPPLEA
jgi:hypothetical protein